ncbi:MAG TPA: GAF domain-containing protein, partial [Nocardioides sp.]|nr:GAF domain-containing protein [Nocardioides sp.]
MEPIPQTLEALHELDAALDDEALLVRLRSTADLAREAVPGLVGVSMASRDQGVTFTLVATAEEIAVLDAVQYVATGPCVDAVDMGHGITTSAGGLLDEARWSDFARASAAAGIHSTLTLPVVDDDRVVGTVNCYGRDEDTFVDRHEALADIFGAWAPGA